MPVVVNCELVPYKAVLVGFFGRCNRKQILCYDFASHSSILICETTHCGEQGQVWSTWDLHTGRANGLLSTILMNTAHSPSSEFTLDTAC